MVQIVQLVPTSQSGQFFAWVVVEGIMLRIPLTVPRVFYLNSKVPLEEKFPGRRSNKTLPHGKQAYNLFEVLLVLLSLKLYLLSHFLVFLCKGLLTLKFLFFCLSFGRSQ